MKKRYLLIALIVVITVSLINCGGGGGNNNTNPAIDSLNNWHVRLTSIATPNSKIAFGNGTYVAVNNNFFT